MLKYIIVTHENNPQDKLKLGKTKRKTGNTTHSYIMRNREEMAIFQRFTSLLRFSVSAVESFMKNPCL